jgi:hypothetical protein
MLMRHPSANSNKDRDEDSRVKRKLVGKYANHFEIGHNAFEFVIDFGQYFSENKEAELCARIITNPFYANNLLTTLQQSIKKYEETYGPII